MQLVERNLELAERNTRLVEENQGRLAALEKAVSDSAELRRQLQEGGGAGAALVGYGITAEDFEQQAALVRELTTDNQQLQEETQRLSSQ